MISSLLNVAYLIPIVMRAFFRPPPDAKPGSAVAIEEAPDILKHAFIAGEDARFYEHPGVDYQGITRAAWSLATTGEKSIGGSTITQQLARNFFLTTEKTFTRKIKEIFLALRIEREFDKKEILELYMNKIFLGYRAYGVGAAAEVYYGKSPGQLSLAQCAMIAALPKAPSRINPITSPQRAVERRNYVLGRMLELGFLEKDAFEKAVNEPDRAYYHGAIADISAAPKPTSTWPTRSTPATGRTCWSPIDRFRGWSRDWSSRSRKASPWSTCATGRPWR